MENYNRLIQRDEVMNWSVNTAELISELKKREQTKVSQNTADQLVDIIANRLADLEDKIENGTLTWLPCKVGDTVYWACPYCEEEAEIYCGKIRGLSISQNGTKWFSVAYDNGLTFEHVFDADWDGTVFLTKAEAEAKLAELKGAER